MNEYETMRKAVFSIVNFLFISVFIIQVYVIIEEYQHPHEISTSQHHAHLEACQYYQLKILISEDYDFFLGY